MPAQSLEISIGSKLMVSRDAGVSTFYAMQDIRLELNRTLSLRKTKRKYQVLFEVL